MNIFVSTRFSSITSLLRAKNLTFLPRGASSNGSLSACFQGEVKDVWIAEGSEIEASHLRDWRRSKPYGPLNLMLRDIASIHGLSPLAKELDIQVHPFPIQNSHTVEEWENEVFVMAESLHAEAVAAAARGLVTQSKLGIDRKKVVLVGAGIVNLITAERLARSGYAVQVVDAAPDPRCCEDWTCLGVTNGGGDARMYTLTEADNYNEKGSEIYQDMASIFRGTVREGKWSVKDPLHFTSAELAWIDAFENIPAWMARIYSKNIYQINRESGGLWQELMAEAPALFEDVQYAPDILRMYVEPVAVKAAVALNKQLGALLKDTSLEEFLSAHPEFKPANDQGELAGGITVKGFTVNVHSFVSKLIRRIESLGGGFHWDCRIERILRNESGKVNGIAGHGASFQADHYVISPGVGGNGLLKGLASENLIQGVLGVWLQIPNVGSRLKHSIKIHRRGHKVEDINVTVAVDKVTGEEILIFGGGYGYVGLDRPAVDSPELKALFDELEEVARIYFPEGYAQAKANRGFYPQGHKKFCIRPFTPSGLGVFEIQPVEGGGQLIVTGGHNTGGFAQAPAVARAVWRALEGIPDNMHTWFHPKRCGHALVPNPQVQISST